jgi:hypothetical protein
MAIALCAAACSTVPTNRYPAFEERSVEADYVFAAPDQHRAAVPASTEALWVRELASTPAAIGEVFEHGQRYLLAPADCARLQVRCRYRAYAQQGAFPAPASLFPGAMVRELP